MSALLPCPACGTLVVGATCPSCAAGRRPARGALAATALLGLTLGANLGCGEAEYGVVVTGPEDDTAAECGLSGACDLDCDGVSEADGDCDDDNADVYPGAEETPGDGVDSNCDGEDDT